MQNLLKELLVEFPCDASPLSASSFELLRRDPDVLHVAAQHEVNLGEQSLAGIKQGNVPKNKRLSLFLSECHLSKLSGNVFNNFVFS